MSKRTSKDDRTLVEACINRDLSGWSELVARYSGLVSLSIENRLKNYGIILSLDEVKDIRQDVLISVWKENKLQNVKNRKDISYWLAIVSGNAAVEYMRKRQSLDQFKTVSIYDHADGKELIEILPSNEDGPLEGAAGNEIADKISEAVEKLAGKERLIMKLNLLYGKKYHEIAAMLNMPGGTVSSYVKRGKEKLRRSLRYII